MESMGGLIRAMRHKRGLSQATASTRAQVTKRALQYWEADRQRPRDVELESLLQALQATEQERNQVLSRLGETQSIRLSRTGKNSPDGANGRDEPLPGLGDLLRAMRQRRGWTQEQLAETMSVNRATVIRWEATRTMPSHEDCERLCLLLNAIPSERDAILAGRLAPSSWPLQLPLEQCQQQVVLLAQIRAGNSALLPLVDLHTLALKRQLWFLLPQSTEALRLLATVEVQHGWWLHMQGKKENACRGNWRALRLVQGTLPPEQFWVSALNILSAHEAEGPSGPSGALRLLRSWLPSLPSRYRFWVLCDMAYYAGRAQWVAEAQRLLIQAETVLVSLKGENINEGIYLYNYRLVKARVFISTGQVDQALSLLPPFALRGDGAIHELLIWVEAYLAVGEKDIAGQHLKEAQRLLGNLPLPLRQKKLQELARKL